MPNFSPEHFDGNTPVDYDYGHALLYQEGGWTAAEVSRESSPRRDEGVVSSTTAALISAFAEAYAGSPLDLDPEFEAAAADFLWFS